MASNTPERRPLAPTSINAILASPLPSPPKATTINTIRPQLPPPCNFHTNSFTSAHRPVYALPAALSATALTSSLPPIRQTLPISGPRPRETLPTLPSISSVPEYAPILQGTKRKIDDLLADNGYVDLCQGKGKIAYKAGQPPTSLAQQELLLSGCSDNCDQVRRKIHAFISAGLMKVTEFQRELNVNSNAYSRFMGQQGATKGRNSEVYPKAYRFFKEREKLGIRIPVKKVKKEEEEKTNDVENYKLSGEETISVPVYDSCDEIRKKIRAHLALPSVSQAGFLREIAKTYLDGRKIQSKVLNDFLGKRGLFAGNTSAVYYSSYVFFEKLRIRDGKPKTKHRTDMEAEYMSEGGIDVIHRDNGKSYC